MLIDAHIHSKGISRCSRLTVQQVLDRCAQDHTQGIVLTNHFKESYINEPFRDWVKRFVEEYEDAKAYGEQIGIQVLFGAEVTLSRTPNIDYLLYGLPPEEFPSVPVLYTYTQKELYRYCCANRALLIQAHPYRNGAVPQDPRFLHGVEINCHPLYKTNEKQRVTAFAKAHDLLLTCGSDYHGDTYKPRCGIEMPEAADIEEFVKNLREKQYSLLVHDIVTE